MVLSNFSCFLPPSLSSPLSLSLSTTFFTTLGAKKKRRRRAEQPAVLTRMAVAFTKAKRLTNLLDEKVRARLRGDEDDHCLHKHHHVHGGYASSGSEHDGASALSGLLDGFFFDDGDDPTTSKDGDSTRDSRSCSDDEPDRRPMVSPARIRDLMTRPRDRFRTQLTADVLKAVESFGGLRENKPSFRRAVMGFLRDTGHNAGVCKSRWDKLGGLTAGSYEYNDVLRSSSGERYIIDLEFSAEFEIARATEDYKKLVGELPGVFVGRAEELKQAARLLAEAAKRSMRVRDMNLPPWRKARYMQNKWLGPYKRTTNAAATEVVMPLVTTSTAFGKGWEAQCREVGFVPARQHIVPPARMR